MSCFTNLRIAENEQTLTVQLDIETPTRPIISKRLHDINSALRTLEFCSEAIKTGYRFDDSMAEAKITALLKAVATMKDEAEPIVTAYKQCLEKVK